MLKILVVVIVLSLLFLWIKSDRKNKIKNKKNDSQDKNNNKEQSQIPKSDMIECAKCSTYIAISESVMSNGKYICPNDCK